MDNLHIEIIEALSDRAMAGGSLAWTMKVESSRVREALDDLIEQGMVEKTRDGYQYQLTEKGRNPPFGGDAA